MTPVWITRTHTGWVTVSSQEPAKFRHSLADISDSVAVMHEYRYADFSKLTGLKLRPGQSVRRRIRLEVVK